VAVRVRGVPFDAFILIEKWGKSFLGHVGKRLAVRSGDRPCSNYQFYVSTGGSADLFLVHVHYRLTSTPINLLKSVMLTLCLLLAPIPQLFLLAVTHKNMPFMSKQSCF
jgi:hypothetical protein